MRQEMIGLVAVGATASVLALGLSVLETRYLLAVVLAIAGTDLLLWLGAWTRVRMVLVTGLVAGLSIGLSVTFFLHVSVPGSYLPFVGGAEGVTLSLSLLCALGYAGARAAAGGPPWRTSATVVAPQILFMAAGLASLLGAAFPVLTMLEELRLLSLLLISIVVMNLTASEITLYMRVLGLSVMLQASIVALQWATGRSLGLSIFGEGALIEQTTSAGQVGRPVGTFGDPNIAAYFFEITGPLMLLLAASAARWADRLLYGGAVAAAWLGALLTLSRGAWIVLPGCSMLALVCFLGRRLLRPPAAWVLATVVAGAAVAALGAWPFLADRMFGEDGGSAGHRMPLTRAAWLVLGEHPLLGVGLNNFAVVMERADPTGYFRIFPHVNQVVHNLHLLVWTEVGTLGFAAYLLLFGAGWATAFQLRHAAEGTRALAFGTAFGLLAHFLHGFVDPGFKLSLVISQLLISQFGVLAWLQLQQRDRS